MKSILIDNINGDRTISVSVLRENKTRTYRSTRATIDRVDRVAKKCTNPCLMFGQTTLSISFLWNK